MVRDHIWARWMTAVLHAQKTGELNKLAAVFLSNYEIRDSERKLLAALCDRGQFKKKRGGQLTPIGKMSLQARYAMLANQVRRLQTGEDKLIDELTVKQIKETTGCNVEIDDPKGWDKNAYRISKLRDAKGRMRHDEAIRLTAERAGVSSNTLADYINRKSGSSRGGWKRWPKKIIARSAPPRMKIPARQ